MSTESVTVRNAKTRVNVKTITQIGMLAAIAVVLMLFEIPLPFAPAFYQIDFSEVPVLVGCFAMGPVAGAVIEMVKIILNLLMNGTVTAGVGEMANFLIGCAFCVPAGIIYREKQDKENGSDRFDYRNGCDDSGGLSVECLCTSSGLCKSV